MTDQTEKIIEAAVAGLVGTLIPAFIAWSHDRDANAARMRKLDEAIKRVAFWDAWLKVSVQLSTTSDVERMRKIEQEMAALGHALEMDSQAFQQEVAQQQTVVKKFAQTRHALPAWRRALLLYAPKRMLAWFPRLLFYVGMVTLMITLLVLAFDRTQMLGGVLVVILEVGWCFLFYSLSRWLEQPQHSLVVAVPAPPPPLG